MDTHFQILGRLPTVTEFQHLRAGAGWHVPDDDAAAAALAGCITGAVAVIAESSAVGMARMISDGRLVALITDVAVHPDYRGQGVGRALVDQLTSWAKARDFPHIALGAADHVAGFYLRAGFSRTGDYLRAPGA